MQWLRFKLTVLTDTLTGHRKLKVQLHRINHGDDPTCGWGTDSEIIRYIVCDYPEVPNG